MFRLVAHVLDTRDVHSTDRDVAFHAFVFDKRFLGHRFDEELLLHEASKDLLVLGLNRLRFRTLHVHPKHAKDAADHNQADEGAHDARP